MAIGTAASGGSWYPVGLGIAELWNDKLKDIGVRASAQVTAGAPENIDMMRRGELQFAMMHNITGIPAWQGVREFENKPYRDMRSVAKLFDLPQCPVVLSKFYKTGNVKDLNGLRYSVGAVGSGTAVEQDLILGALGIKVQKVFLNWDQAADALQDGRIDAANMAGLIPQPTLQRLLTAGVDLKLLNYTEEDMKKINSVLDYTFLTKIPANTYKGQPQDVTTIAQPTFLVARADVDEELVYRATKAMFENPEQLAKTHQAMKGFSLDKALEGLKIPLHPGAIRYYKEQGIKIPDNLIPK